MSAFTSVFEPVHVFCQSTLKYVCKYGEGGRIAVTGSHPQPSPAAASLRFQQCNVAHPSCQASTEHVFNGCSISNQPVGPKQLLQLQEGKEDRNSV